MPRTVDPCPTCGAQVDDVTTHHGDDVWTLTPCGHTGRLTLSDDHVKIDTAPGSRARAGSGS